MRRDGSRLEGFLRLERQAQPGEPGSLAEETRIVAALGRSPALPAWLSYDDTQ